MSTKSKRLSRREIDFMRGYYCCLAALLKGHGDNTYIGEYLNHCGTDEEIIRYADEGDVQEFQAAGYLQPANPQEQQP